MTRRHSQALAAALKSTKPQPESPDAVMYQWRETVRSVAAVCREFVRGFDPGQFQRDCDYYAD